MVPWPRVMLLLPLARETLFPPAEPCHTPHWPWQLLAHELVAGSSLASLLLVAWLPSMAGSLVCRSLGCRCCSLGMRRLSGVE